MGGLGAVLSVTPPQLSSNGLATIAGASAATSGGVVPSTAAVTVTQAAAPAASASASSSAAKVTAKKAATSKATKKATSKSNTTSTTTSNSSSSSSSTSNNSNNSNSSSSNSTATNNAVTNTPTPSPTPAETKSVSGSFTGDTINVGYGLVQVKITVSNGRITDATALQSPNGRSQRFSDYALPNLRQQTLQAQSANIQGVSGASYTSYGWYKSLISALQKAGMKTGV